MVDADRTAAGRAVSAGGEADAVPHTYRQPDPYPHAHPDACPHAHVQPDSYQDRDSTDCGALADGDQHLHPIGLALADEHCQPDVHAAPGRDQHAHGDAGAYTDRYTGPAGAGHTDAGALKGGEKV